MCTIYSAKVSDLLHYLGPPAIKTLKANLACPVTGLTVHVLKIPSQRYVWKCWMGFACAGQACCGWMVPQMPVQCFLEQLGLQCVNLVMYQSVSSRESADLGHWSSLSNLLLAILFTESFPYQSRRHGVDWALGWITLVQYKQLVSADWALLLYCTYSPILVMFFNSLLIPVCLFMHTSPWLLRVSKTDFRVVCSL